MTCWDFHLETTVWFFRHLQKAANCVAKIEFFKGYWAKNDHFSSEISCTAKDLKNSHFWNEIREIKESFEVIKNGLKMAVDLVKFDWWIRRWRFGKNTSRGKDRIPFESRTNCCLTSESCLHLSKVSFVSDIFQTFGMRRPHISRNIQGFWQKKG